MIENIKLNQILDELIKVLDEDVKHIEMSVAVLDELRAKVIKRDEQGLQLLLEKVRISIDRHNSIEDRRKFLRKNLAGMLGWPVEKTTLTNLAKVLDENRRDQLSQKKCQISELLFKLKTEHMSTSMLLTECCRFNSIMLNALMGGRQDQITYDRSGSRKRYSKQNMVNIQL